MNFFAKCFLPVALAACVLPCNAEISKCVDPSGAITYTDRACPEQSVPQPVRLPDLASKTGDPAKGPKPSSACVALARPIWEALARESGGQLSGPEAEALRAARDALRAECQMQLSISTLAIECPKRREQLTQAVARGQNAITAAERDRQQTAYEQVCSRASIDFDIERHLRPVEQAPDAP